MNRLQELVRYIQINKKVQVGISFICFFMLVLYIFFYCSSLFNVYFSLLNNDINVKKEESNGTLYKIDKISEKDGKFIVKTKPNTAGIRFTSQIGEFFYQCYYNSEENNFVYSNDSDDYKFCYKGIDDLRIVTAIKHLLYYLVVDQKRTLSHLQKVIINEDDNFIYAEISKKYRYDKEEKNVQISKDLPLYNVYIVSKNNQDIQFRIDFYIGDEVKSSYVDSIYNVDIKKIDTENNTVTISLNNSFSIVIFDNSIINCTSLSDNEKYFSSKSNAVIQNVDPDFWVFFAQENNMHVVELSICLLLLGFILTYRDGKFVLFSNRKFADVTFIFMLVLLFLTFLTYTLLGTHYK